MDVAIPESVVAYCDSVTGRLGGVSGDLVAVYLHGSACLGGWNPEVSDVDLLIVVGDGATRSTVEAMVGVLIGSFAECPGRGLECSIVPRHAVANPHPPWLHLAHVNSEADDPAQAYPQSPEDSDPDLLMHYAVCRSAGIAIAGPPCVELIGIIDHRMILGYLADEMEWGLENGSGAYALLNACRAGVYLRDNRIVSKIAGGLIALKIPAAPHRAIQSALAAQQGRDPAIPLTSEAIAFVQSVTTGLRQATQP